LSFSGCGGMAYIADENSNAQVLKRRTGKDEVN
jgi:hypothetical protein